MKRHLTLSVAVTVVAAFFVAAMGSGATIQVGNVSNASPGSTITVPITLADGGSGSCALEYSLTWDAEALTYQGVSTGGAASAAGKQAYDSQKTAGAVKISVFGVNSTDIASGVIANATFKLNSAASGAIAVGGQCSVSDCLGNLTESTCAAGAVVVNPRTRPRSVRPK